MKKRILSFTFAFVFAALQLLAALPAYALLRSSARIETPAGYNENDYQKLVAFMELKDPNGVRNGEKVVAPFNGYYIPTFPESWSYFYYDHEFGAIYTWGVFWSDESESRVIDLRLYDMDLVGPLDLSGCAELSEVYCDQNSITSINASDCPQLRSFMCSHNALKQLDISGCTALDLFDCSHNGLSELDASGIYTLTDIECNDNDLTSLNVSGCTSLGWLDCFNNPLTELDLKDCTGLYYLDCTGDPLTSLELAPASPLAVESIKADGQGTVCYSGSSYGTETAAAAPDPGAEFLGWYSEAGELISASLELNVRTCGHTRLVARFTPASVLPGDVNNDGSVNANDALTVLRYALGLIGEIAPQADVNGDGSVNANDALLILRAALGLATL